MKHRYFVVVLATLLSVGAAAGQRQSSISIEIEDLLSSAMATGGQLRRQNMRGFGGGWGGGAQLFWNAPTPGKIDWPQLLLVFSVPSANTYEVVLHYTSAPDFGTFGVVLDGQPRADVDAYSPAVTPQNRSLGQHKLSPGKHELRVAVFSKAVGSKGFSVGLDRIELRPVVEQGTRNAPSGVSDIPEAASAATTIPVLKIPAGATAIDDSPAQQKIEPLPMSTRFEMTQKTLASTSTPLGQPGAPIRLSAALPKRDLSGLSVKNGEVDASADTIYIAKHRDTTLDLYFDPVEPHRPHLLECGCFIGWTGTPVSVRLSGNISGQKYAELSVITLSGTGTQRLLSVVVPSESHIQLQLAPRDQDFVVHYCELTPFK